MAAFRRRPSKEVLEDLYVRQGLSITKIAAKIGSTQSSVSGWLGSYGIPIRPAVQPVPSHAPSADDLRRMVHEDHLSYREIGQRFGAGPMAVQIWLDKYGIPRAKVGPSLVSRNKPSLSELRDLYINQKMSTREIGKIYSVRHITIRRWLAGYGIEIRPKGQGLLHRGVTPPTREDLQHMIHVEHLSYAQVAAKYGVDPAAIQHWLTKHGIEKPKVWVTRRKGEEFPMPSLEVLRELYEAGVSTTTIGSMYRVHGSTVGELMEKYGIKRRPSGLQGGRRWACNDGHEVRSSYERRVDDWLFRHDIPHENDPELPFGTRHLGDFLAGGVYIEVWGFDNDARYDASKAFKKQKYAEFGLPLISIESWMFTRATWHKRLAEGLKDAFPCLTDAPAKLF